MKALKRTVKKAIEHVLLKRLKVLGFLLLGLGLFFLGYAMQPYPDLPLSAFEAEDFIDPKDQLNFFLVSFLFFLVGSLCLLISKKRIKELDRKPKNKN